MALPDAPEAAVPDDVRKFVRAQRLARPDGRATLRHGAVVLAVWVALVAIGIAADSLAVWIPIWLALALCTATPLALMHEAVHLNLFRSRAANLVTGTIAATWLFFHAPAYRAWHLTHHAYTFTEDDSEQLPARFRSRLGYLAFCAVLGPSFAVILWFGAIATLLGKPPRWVRGPRLARHVRIGALASFVVVAAVVAAGL
ncbi:MAG TPA: fatty acid desaturase, partial [Acidimicrobiales bacterium]